MVWEFRLIWIDLRILHAERQYRRRQGRRSARYSRFISSFLVPISSCSSTYSITRRGVGLNQPRPSTMCNVGRELTADNSTKYRRTKCLRQSWKRTVDKARLLRVTPDVHASPAGEGVEADCMQPKPHGTGVPTHPPCQKAF